MASGTTQVNDWQPVAAPQQGGAAEPTDWQTVPAPSADSAVSRFLAPMNPMGIVHALFKPSANPNEDGRATFGKNIIGIVKGLKDAQVGEKDAAVKAWNEGNHTDAIAHGLAALTPIFGPMSQQAADKWIAGDHAGAAGIFASMAAPEIAHEIPNIPGVRAATGAVVDATKAALKAGGKDVAVGAVKAATGGGGMLVGHSLGGETGAVAGAVLGKDLMNAGRKQIVTGLKSGWSAGKNSMFPPIEPPAPVPADVPVAAPAPAGPAPAPQPAPAAPPPNASQYAGPQAAPMPPFQPPPQVNPYFAGGATNAGTRAAAGEAALQPPQAALQPNAAAPAPAPAPAAPPVNAAVPHAAAVPEMTEPQGVTSGKVELTPKESAAVEITRRNTKAANDVKAQYLSDNGYTGDQLKAGDEYKALIDKIPNPNAKTGKFNTKSAYDPEHVQTVADLVDAKNVIRDKAAELQAKGVTADTMKPSDVKGMNPEEAARVLFRLRNQAKPGAVKAAEAFADAMKP